VYTVILSVKYSAPYVFIVQFSGDLYICLCGV